MKSDDKLLNLLKQIQGVNVLPYDLNQEELVILDLTAENQEMNNIDPADAVAFSKYILSLLNRSGARVAIGKYNENRTIYDKSAVFGSENTDQGQRTQRRTLHIGLDLWTASGTSVLAALDGWVHSFQDNNALGDYGPTIILKHVIDEVEFFTLYGHLNRQSLEEKDIGQFVKAGQEIAQLGDPDENGNWPPHLHFEIIRDMRGMHGDFPGVCALSRRDEFLELCPDPNLLLKIKALMD
ncbi:MAG: peptidase M23 [Desulfonatronovibrio sp. MSAO_Bac4]|nr:MAG: peptidase M23 [Desulfonatronovibrio sp. MSAO_Bac4]